MKILKWSKDGGPESPVDAFFIVEIKSLLSVALLRFNPGCREAFHTHAFNALTWFISGDLVEESLNSEYSYINYYFYTRSLLPKITHRTKNHRVHANTTSWCFTVRGPWAATWTEDDETHHTVLTHGRQIVEKTKR